MEPSMEPEAPVVPTAETRSKKDLLRTIGFVALGVVIVAVITALLYGLVSHPRFTAVIRDISIIALALVTTIIGLFLIILIFQLQSLIALLRDEIRPILDSANQTAGTVRGTTTFLSDAVIKPMINVVSVASAVGQTVRTLTGGKRRKNGRRAKETGTQE